MQLRIVLVTALLLQCAYTHAQNKDFSDNQLSDSLYIQEVEDAYPAKVLHAEPLYIDLIRDLGARKGEHEWNLGLGVTDKLKYDTYETLVEYEFAPMDRLGLEVELPLTIQAPLKGTEDDELPPHRVESLKVAAQWSFLVNTRLNLSAAVGYINEFVLVDLNKMNSRNVFEANVFNPFLVVAKRWGNNFHSLVYTGPVHEQYYSGGSHTSYQINTSVHYMISGTKNFLGVEFNKELNQGDFDMTIRPQLRVSVADNLLVGIVGGIPINRENERLSSFLRLIWEPGSKH